MLKYSPVFRRKALLPPLEEVEEGECRHVHDTKHCFAAGDNRVNEQPGN
jgi:hypothetical protein